MKTHLLGLVALLAFGCLPASAAFHMTIHLDTKELSFSGSDIAPYSPLIYWTLAPNFFPTETLTYTDTRAFTLSTGSVTSIELHLYDGGGIWLGIYTFGATDPVTVTADSEVRYSYGSLSSLDQQGLEQAAINQRTLQSIPDSVAPMTTSAIPEPSTWALLGLGCVFGIWQFRRRLA